MKAIISARCRRQLQTRIFEFIVDPSYANLIVSNLKKNWNVFNDVRPLTIIARIPVQPGIYLGTLLRDIDDFECETFNCLNTG